METRIEHLELDNKPTGSAATEAHREMIVRNAKDGFSYQGFVPVKIGPSGKILSVDMIFQI